MIIRFRMHTHALFLSTQMDRMSVAHSMCVCVRVMHLSRCGRLVVPWKGALRCGGDGGDGLSATLWTREHSCRFISSFPRHEHNDDDEDDVGAPRMRVFAHCPRIVRAESYTLPVCPAWRRRRRRAAAATVPQNRGRSED